MRQNVALPCPPVVPPYHSLGVPCQVRDRNMTEGLDTRSVSSPLDFVSVLELSDDDAPHRPSSRAGHTVLVPLTNAHTSPKNVRSFGMLPACGTLTSMSKLSRWSSRTRYPFGMCRGADQSQGSIGLVM